MDVRVFDRHMFGWGSERFGLYLPEGTKPTDADRRNLEATVINEDNRS